MLGIGTAQAGNLHPNTYPMVRTILLEDPAVMVSIDLHDLNEG